MRMFDASLLTTQLRAILWRFPSTADHSEIAIVFTFFSYNIFVAPRANIFQTPAQKQEIPVTNTKSNSLKTIMPEQDRDVY